MYQGNIYKLVFQHSKKCVHQVGGNQENGGNITQWEWIDQDNLKVLIFPLEEPWVAIAFRHSGKFIHVEGDAPYENGRNISQWEWVNQNNLKWKIEAVNSNLYKIVSQATDKCLHQSGNVQDDNGNINLWEWVDQSNLKLTIEKIGSYKLPEKLGDIGKASQPLDLDSPEMPDDYSKPVLTKCAIIPYFLVKDPQFRDDWKIKNSPYYVLEREDYYKLLPEYWVNDHDSNRQTGNAGIGEMHLYKQIEVYEGFTTEQSKSFSQATGISVTAEIGVEFLFFSANISTQISHEWGFSESFSKAITSSKKVTETIYYKQGFITSVWRPMHKYTLKRLDGTTVVKPWDVERGGLVYRYYP